MEPSDALGIAAQMAVGLRVSPAWRSFLVANLCTNGRPSTDFCYGFYSAIRFCRWAFSILGMLLLTVKPMLPGIWRWCSGIAFLVSLLFAIIG